MKTKANTIRLLAILLTALLWCTLPVTSFSKETEAVEAGRIVAASGRLLARADDGSERRLRRRSPVYAGDTILVGDNAFIQIRFSDGGLTSLRPGTEFRVSEYHFNGKQDGSETAVFDLVKGGLRTITGAIGKQHKKNYQLNTPVSTIGIRGTHYGVNLCDAGCTSSTGEPLPAGLYGGVVDGAIVVSNEGGEGYFGNDHYFHVADGGSPPQELLGPPGVVFDNLEVQSQPEEQEADEGQAATDGQPTEGGTETASTDTGSSQTEGGDISGFDDTASNSGEVTDNQLIEQPTSLDPGAALGASDTGATATGVTGTLITGTTSTGGATTGTTTSPTALGLTPAPLGSATAIAGVPPLFGPEPFAEIVPQKGTTTDEVYLDTNGMVAQIIHRESPDCLDCIISKGNAVLKTDGLPTGGFTLIEPGEKVYWGRWEGSWYGQDSYGSGYGPGSWHFIYSPNVTHQADLDMLKANNVIASFSQWSPNDGTIPTDEQGNLGYYIGSQRFNVNFGQSRIDNYQVNVGFSTGRNFYGMQPSGQPAYFTGPGTHVPLDVYCSGCTIGTGKGEASVVFVGTNATHAISSFEMEAGTNSAVGTILFTDDSLP